MEHAVPEFEQWLGKLMRQMRHEIAEQDREEDQPEHLPVCRRFDDIRRHHANEDLGNVADALVPDLGLNFFVSPTVTARPSRARRRYSRADCVDDKQADQDRGQRRRCIEQQRLATQRTQIAAGANAGDADNNRRGDQRHDDHLQGVKEYRADEIEHRDESNANRRWLELVASLTLNIQSRR